RPSRCGRLQRGRSRLAAAVSAGAESLRPRQLVTTVPARSTAFARPGLPATRTERRCERGSLSGGCPELEAASASAAASSGRPRAELDAWNDDDGWCPRDEHDRHDDPGSADDAADYGASDSDDEACGEAAEAAEADAAHRGAPRGHAGPGGGRKAELHRV